MATAGQARQLGDDQGVSPSLLGVRLQGEEYVRGKHRRPHGVVIEGTAPDVNNSGRCCSFMFLESSRKHHSNRRCPSVKSQLCLCHCVAIHSTAHLSFARHLRRLKAPQTVPPARIVIRHGGRTGLLHENCRRDGGTDGSTIRGKGFGQRPSPNHGRTTTEKIVEWNRRKIEASAS